MWWNHHPWKCLKGVWMWHLGFGGEHGGTRLMAGPEVQPLEVFFSLHESVKAGARFWESNV